MADDILLTPEEQDERAKQWLKDNGLAIFIGVAIGLGAVIGYNGYQEKKKNEAEQASALYEQVLAEIKDSEISDVQDQVDQLKNDYADTSYAAKAVLLRAKQLSVSDINAALVELKWVSDHADESGLKHTAQIRQAKILLSQNKLEEAKAIANTGVSSSFASNYYEILGDVAVSEGDHENARQYYQQSIDTSGAGNTNYVPILTLKMNRVPLTKSDSVEAAPASTDTAVKAPVEVQEIAESVIEIAEDAEPLADQENGNGQ